MKRSLLLTLVLAASAAQAQNSGLFVEPKDGAVVGSEFKVATDAEGWQVRPFGDMTAGTGHHHLLINPAAPVETGKLIPVDQPERVMHFGKGQAETVVKLAPGRYMLQLQLGDGAHNSLGQEARAAITATLQ